MTVSIDLNSDQDTCRRHQCRPTLIYTTNIYINIYLYIFTQVRGVPEGVFVPGRNMPLRHLPTSANHLTPRLMYAPFTLDHYTFLLVISSIIAHPLPRIPSVHALTPFLWYALHPITLRLNTHRNPKHPGPSVYVTTRWCRVARGDAFDHS